MRERLERALRRLLDTDRYLLENDLSERCIAARLAMYLCELFPDRDVDVEYNRIGDVAKRLRGLPAECFRRRNRPMERATATFDLAQGSRPCQGAPARVSP